VLIGRGGREIWKLWPAVESAKVFAAAAVMALAGRHAATSTASAPLAIVASGAAMFTAYAVLIVALDTCGLRRLIQARCASSWRLAHRTANGEL
jgi:hypothetical protein